MLEDSGHKQEQISSLYKDDDLETDTRYVSPDGKYTDSPAKLDSLVKNQGPANMSGANLRKQDERESLLEGDKNAFSGQLVHTMDGRGPSDQEDMKGSAPGDAVALKVNLEPKKDKVLLLSKIS